MAALSTIVVVVIRGPGDCAASGRMEILRTDGEGTRESGRIRHGANFRAVHCRSRATWAEPAKRAGIDDVDDTPSIGYGSSTPPARRSRAGPAPKSQPRERCPHHAGLRDADLYEQLVRDDVFAARGGCVGA